MTIRIDATPAALDLLARLIEQHGPVLFHLSGGCCDGSAPMCYPRAEFAIGQRDVYLGPVGPRSTPFYMGGDQYVRWEHTHLTLDVVPGRGSGFSLESPGGVRFMIRSRLFTAQEQQSLVDAGPALRGEQPGAPAGTSIWADAAAKLDWFHPWDTVCQWDAPDARWFDGGQLNACHNAVDRHVAAGRGDVVAFHFEGEPGDTRTITYADLLVEVQRAANVLRSLGVVKGDRVAIYLPMIPEAVVAMLACARIGAAHSVIFGGFSPAAIADRINDAACKVVITADGGFRRGTPSLLKPNIDRALEDAPSVEAVLVVRRLALEPAIDMVEGRDHWWHEKVEQAEAKCPCEPMASEDLLFILYTSGTTAKPKGVMHTTGGYLTQVAHTHAAVFDLKSDDVYWCTADVGWITGHSYIVYGPLTNGCTSVLYEGTPDTPHRDRFWRLIERYGVTIFYTAPTAIRMFMKWGDHLPAGWDLSSLRVLGSVGEPINPEAWSWYRQHIGGDHCPVIDTWWQTETGAIMIAPRVDQKDFKPGSALSAIDGIMVEVVDDAGDQIATGDGLLTIAEPWPSMLRGIWGDRERFIETYWSSLPGRYFAGDGARLDQDGDIWLLGRVDDVMNISGHRISTAEIESALVDHPAVAEAAVVGANDDTTGQAIVGFVILRDGHIAGAVLADEIRQHVATRLGPIARPRRLLIVDDLPKTRSGKIMRRILRDLSDGKTVGDTSTIADPSVVSTIAEQTRIR